MTELPWVKAARKLIGTREVKGAKHNNVILRMWQLIKRGGIKDDETPWCAAFVGSCLEQVGIKSSRYESAASYLGWGVKLTEPEYGALAVFTRDGGGHVGFIVGKDFAGRLLILGGNQGDEVNIKPFDKKRVAGYRWPANITVPKNPMPVLSSSMVSSENEA